MSNISKPVNRTTEARDGAARARQLLDQGDSVHQVAKRMGVHRDTVRRWTRKGAR